MLSRKIIQTAQLTDSSRMHAILVSFAVGLVLRLHQGVAARLQCESSSCLLHLHWVLQSLPFGMDSGGGMWKREYEGG